MPQETELTELNVATAALGCPRGATRPVCRQRL